MRMQCERNAYHNHIVISHAPFPVLIGRAMRQTFESIDAFVARVLREKGFGMVTVQPAPPRPPIAERTRDEILAEQSEREAVHFGHCYKFGPAEKWEVAK